MSKYPSVSYNPDFKIIFKTNHRREKLHPEFDNFLVFDMEQDTSHDETLRAIIDLRVYYMDTYTTACVWVSCSKSEKGSADSEVYTQGSALSKEFSDRTIDAVEKALHNAGFTIEMNYNQMANRSIEKALLAIARYLGIQAPGFFLAHP